MYVRRRPTMFCSCEAISSDGIINLHRSAFCREMLLGGIRYQILGERVSIPKDITYNGHLLMNRIGIVPHYEEVEKIFKKKINSRKVAKDIILSIGLFAGIISTCIIHNPMEYEMRKEVKRPIEVNKNGVRVNFLSPLMFSSIPIASLILGLVRIGYNIATVKENKPLMTKIRKSFDRDTVLGITMKGDRKEAINIWNNFIKKFASDFHIEILKYKQIQEVIDFFSEHGIESLFPISRFSTFWNKQSEYYGIYNYTYRINFYSRRDVKKILERDKNGKYRQKSLQVL